MAQFDKVLKLYAENGLRTTDDWASLGRDIKAGAEAKADVTHRGAVLRLYSRDQTQTRVRVRAGQP